MAACASRAPGAESVKVQDAKLAADPTATLALGGVFGAKRKHLAEWQGCKSQDDCSLGGTIGGTIGAAAVLKRAPAPCCSPCAHAHDCCAIAATGGTSTRTTRPR